MIIYFSLPTIIVFNEIYKNRFMENNKIDNIYLKIDFLIL